MGYGLAAIPKTLFRERNNKLKLKYFIISFIDKENFILKHLKLLKPLKITNLT